MLPVEDNDNLEDIIDSSWLEEQEKLQNVDSVFHREPMTNIQSKFIYINTHNYIDKIICKSIPLQKNDSITLLQKEVLIKTIDTNKLETKNSRFKLIDVLLCNFDILPSSVHAFSKNSSDKENANNCIKTVNPLNDLIIQPSTFLFHDVNSLFFIFQEEEFEEEKMVVPKSILKQKSELGKREPSNKKHTKKVRIADKFIQGSLLSKKNITRKSKIKETLLKI